MRFERELRADLLDGHVHGTQLTEQPADAGAPWPRRPPAGASPAIAVVTAELVTGEPDELAGRGAARGTLLLRAPSVYRAQGDTWLLAEVLRREPAVAGGRVLDVCAGSGALAVAAARLGAAEVTATDVSRRAVASSWLNARARGLSVRVRRGDLFEPVEGERFDVIVANPPYVPARAACPPLGGAARAWDAGVDGRAVIDRLCREAPPHLAPGGILLIVFSALCGTELTVQRLRSAGLDVCIVARRTEPFGRVMNGRVSLLEARELITPGQRHEELVVVRAQAA